MVTDLEKNGARFKQPSKATLRGILNIGRFYTRGRIIYLDEIRQTFVARLVMRLKYKDGHNTHNRPPGRTIFRGDSFKTNNGLYIRDA